MRSEFIIFSFFFCVFRFVSFISCASVGLQKILNCFVGWSYRSTTQDTQHTLTSEKIFLFQLSYSTLPSELNTEYLSKNVKQQATRKKFCSMTHWKQTVPSNLCVIYIYFFFYIVSNAVVVCDMPCIISSGTNSCIDDDDEKKQQTNKQLLSPSYTRQLIHYF